MDGKGLFPARYAFFLALAIFSLMASPGPSAGDEPATKAGTWTFYFENDTFFDTDYLYTNGVKLTWISSARQRWQDQPVLPKWSHALVARMPVINRPGARRALALSIGQNMYTPGDTRSQALVPDDRPYAGVTYLTLGFNCKDRRQMDTLELALGIVGPHAYAEDTQRIVHEIKGVHVPEGWGNQLKDEPLVNLFAERKWRWRAAGKSRGFGVDAIPNAGAGLGNALIYGHAGCQVRLGWNLPNDFGTQLIRPGSDTNAPLDRDDPRFFRPRNRFGVHLFAGADLQWVVRDITLDGNTFQSSHSVEREPVVGDAMVGIGLILHRFKISFAHVFPGRDFKEQERRHEYGSITVSFSY